MQSLRSPGSQNAGWHFVSFCFFVLSPVERVELNHQLTRCDLLRRQLKQLHAQIVTLQERHPAARIIATMPGAAAYSSLGLACRVGDIRRFKHPRSLANYWGLTPGSRNSGDTNRLGSITKQGRSNEK